MMLAGFASDGPTIVPTGILRKLTSPKSLGWKGERGDPPCSALCAGTVSRARWHHHKPEQHTGVFSTLAIGLRPQMSVR